MLLPEPLNVFKTYIVFAPCNCIMLLPEQVRLLFWYLYKEHVMELLEFKTKILKLCNVRDIKNIGEVLMKVVLSNETCFFDKYKEIIDNNKDWLQALWQYYEADRAEKKQDYTPKSLCKLVSALAGNCETIYDCCGGSGALTVQMLKDSKAKFVCVEELDEKVIPFLLFNLCLHNVSSVNSS